MMLKIRNPNVGIYAVTNDYIHALEVNDMQRILFVSGTMGLDENAVAGADLAEQLQLVWQNIRAILKNANMTTDNIVRVTSYLRQASFAEANQNARVTALAGRTVPTTSIVVQTLETDWLVEIEIIAAA
ncbi:MAG: enamine deaminase RidA [Hyphomicrobiales bacterium]|nr:MAG: enamine deaminase RidA [Hyphomicrobiales bacterium]